MDMITYAALSRQIRESGGGNAGAGEQDLFRFGISDDNYISCTQQELLAALENGKIVLIDDFSTYVALNHKYENSKITLYGLSINYSYLMQHTYVIAADGKVSVSVTKQYPDIDYATSMIKDELISCTTANIHLACIMSNDFVVMDNGITCEQLFEALLDNQPVRAIIQILGNPILTADGAVYLSSDTVRWDYGCTTCVFSFQYQGKSFELSIQDDGTIEFAEVTLSAT